MRIDSLTKQKLIDLPIEKVAEKLGMKVTRHMALCFMHDDHHPSFAFNVASNRWRCYVCNEWGDNISLVMRYNNQGFLGACCWLAEQFGISIEGGVNMTTVVQPRPVPAVKPKETVVQDVEMLQAILDHCRLTSSALAFLCATRCYSEAVVKGLGIKALEDEKALVRFLINRFGVARSLKSHLVFRRGDEFVSYFHAPCIFFPYYDFNGKLLTLQARYLGDSEVHQRFQFPKGASTSMYNLQILSSMSEHEPLFISEGVTDTIALLSSGYKAIAIPSATLLKEKELQQIASHPLLMYPDNDVPGERLFENIKKAVADMGGYILRLHLPAGCKDFSEFYIKNIASNVIDASGRTATIII